MNEPDEKYVYHGSRELFEQVKPKRQIRSRINKDGVKEIVFDEISFHATPYKWVAIAYTYTPTPFKHKVNGKICSYNMGVNLYQYKEEIAILGFNSLEESLDQMYGAGGYLFIFEKDKFFYTKGLGDLEVITKENLIPLEIEKIDDPVAELKKLGIKFDFIDLGLSKNEVYRNYCQ